MWVGFQIDRVNLPVWGTVELGEWLSVGVTVLWFVGILNAINLIDGLDGLAGGVAFFAVVTLFSVTLMDQDVNLLTTLFCCALGGAVVRFLFYNFNPATIFMGDGGSLFLGFIIATVGVHTQAKSNTASGVNRLYSCAGPSNSGYRAFDLAETQPRKRSVFCGPGAHSSPPSGHWSDSETGGITPLRILQFSGIVCDCAQGSGRK